MTPRTRKSNQETDFKVYYSKKVPKQVHFPNRRKRVRRPGTSKKDESEGRQTKLLQKKIKTTNGGAIMDSEDEEDEEDVALSLHSEGEDYTTEVADQDKAQHEIDTVQDVSNENKKPIKPTSKRKRNVITQRGKQFSKVHEPVSEDDQERVASEADERVEPNRKLRRQSTMTQIADGRRPSPNAEEPGFRPAKRRSRTSLGGRGTTKKDRKQQTLTQMIPGMMLLVDEETEDMDDLQMHEGDDQANGDTVAQRLSQQGLSTTNDSDEEQLHVQNYADSVHSITKGIKEVDASLDFQKTTPPLAVQSVKNESDDAEEYFPTQFIDAPSRNVTRTSRRQSNKAITVQNGGKPEASERGEARRSRFSLLSTPEKRRVFEIPSSQSPAESLFSTQNSPAKVNRLVMQEQSSNTYSVPETPSKRKQVTFQTEAKQYVPPPNLRRFNSTVQDSEDEEESDIEETLSDTNQSSIHSVKHFTQDRLAGEHTQVILNQIDQACAHADESAAWDNRDSSEEPEEPTTFSGPHETSPELGESWAPFLYDDDPPDIEASYGSACSKASGFPSVSDPMSNDAALLPDIQPVGSLPALVSNDELPSTPLVLQDESSDDDDDDSSSTTPRTSRQRKPPATSTAINQPADLDGEPIQVPRSPSAPRATQQSHSSKAEQQLQTEWLSYSQYVGARPSHSSSLLAHAANSYDPTPRQPQNMPPEYSGHMLSQATTIDEVTPKKNRHHHVISTNTTPHRMAKSQPFISPSKPPSLFIPSSFPSPSAARVEDWSSPLLHTMQQNYGSSQITGSIDDFSIPPPPPIEHD